MVFFVVIYVFKNSLGCPGEPRSLGLPAAAASGPKEPEQVLCLSLVEYLKILPWLRGSWALALYTVDARRSLGQVSACMARCVQVRSCMQESLAPNMLQTPGLHDQQSHYESLEGQAFEQVHPCASRRHKLGLKSGMSWRFTDFIIIMNAQRQRGPTTVSILF